MKKKVRTILVAALFIGGFALSFNSAEARRACPTTDCSTDCDSGTICSITQYENGQLCSTTTCYGRGPDFGEQ